MIKPSQMGMLELLAQTQSYCNQYLALYKELLDLDTTDEAKVLSLKMKMAILWPMVNTLLQEGKIRMN